ncbi:hypothetical protein SL054_002489 [Flavobacterium psychrophilum]|uniref:Uncharacterized protein n=1 Tax=Flavobacterium psychrophilum TaxID=96345 RepID=A0A7U2NGU0_FLAPS|nr:hypothetical protein [Flavobacterium psychrophilum]EKT4499984.1 hypothetical protein [Flavobacterium psychrophilum]EKT4550774.1 hypothetical protein [Flavobacterium psychrophilum]EKT4553240.1 hypothetical protein [Flavobacterium psychrophilum]ELM3645101.1 hypothetical protein [Flavobacterium psychrophilum]ELM3651557.1 hypothetical protein [Flavobacterium psychrophilum]
MTKKINIVENGQSFDFELDENGYIWLLNNEFEGSKINIGQVSGNIRTIESAESNAREMLYVMNILSK